MSPLNPPEKDFSILYVTITVLEGWPNGFQPKAGPPWAERHTPNMYYYVHILQSEKTGKLYKGTTANLKDRVTRHNTGKVTTTKAYLPWKLVYFEGFVSKKDARREELFLKTGKGRERIKYLLTEL